jgi:apolipoprotein N-acyltransferase
VIVWPETASPVFPLDQIAPARDAIIAAAGLGPNRPGAALVGSVGFAASGRPRNSLVAFGPDGIVRDTYDKWHLVPFGEFQPDWFPLPIQVVPGGGFAPGSGPKTFHLAGVPPVGPMICYEAIYSGEMVDEADRPAWLVNVTNDAWFGNSSGPRQHLAQVRMRAVEEGLPLLRAANTGISAAFDAFGHEMARLGLGKTGYLVVSLPPALPRTLFARGGLAIPGALAVLALALGFLVCHIKRLFSCL